MLVAITNILLTRRCNLNCPQCKITRNYPNSPYRLPRKELDWKEWFEFITSLKQTQFHTIYGGEPLLYDGIEDLICSLNSKGIPYTIISNGLLLDQLKVVPYGLSLSCDGTWNNMDVSNKRRSEMAFELLPLWKQKGVKDAVAVFTTNALNYKVVKDVVRHFSHHRVVTEVTLLDQPKSEYYDFADTWDNGNLIKIPEDEFNLLMDELSEMKRNGFLIHNNLEFFELAKMYGRTDNYICKEPWRVLTVDCDGSLRLCYRIKGLETPKYTIWDLMNGKDEEIKRAMMTDHKNLCRGCNWNCIMMAETNADFEGHGLRRDLWYG